MRKGMDMHHYVVVQTKAGYAVQDLATNVIVMLYNSKAKAESVANKLNGGK